MDVIENDDYSSQLRSLRLILGKNFRPISTKALADLTAIPLVAIRAVEAGRRAINDEDRDAIDLFLGARWDPQRHQWRCAPAHNSPDFEFSRIQFVSYCKRDMESRLSVIKKDTAALTDSIVALLRSLKDKEAVLALCKLHRKVYELAQLNNLPKNLRESIMSRFPVQEPKPALPARLTPEIREALGDLKKEPATAAPGAKRTKPKRQLGDAASERERGK